MTQPKKKTIEDHLVLVNGWERWLTIIQKNYPKGYRVSESEKTFLKDGIQEIREARQALLCANNISDFRRADTLLDTLISCERDNRVPAKKEMENNSGLSALQISLSLIRKSEEIIRADYEIWKTKLVSDPNVLNGELTFPHAPISMVSVAAQVRESGEGLAQALAKYPALTAQDVAFAVHFVQENLCEG